MLEVRGISYRYQSNPWLFKQVNMDIHPGEVVGLYGKSGSGKTTMAKIIAGYLKPYEGYVRVDRNKYPIDGHHPVQLIWQHPEKAVNPRWKMKQTLAEAGQLNSKLLEEFGINSEWMRRYPSQLSSGELQRFCLVRALGSKTKYLIADEITTMLDAITQAQIWDIVLRLAEQRNIGILAISHDLPLLKQTSDRLVDFKDLAAAS